MKTIRKNMMYAAAALFLLSSCGSKKMVTTQPKLTPSENVTPQKTVKADDTTAKSKALPNTPKATAAVQYLTSKVRITFPNKGISLGGTMKMKSDERVQLSVFMPIFHNELMKAEITPNEVLVIDRMNKQYVKATRSELAQYLPKNSNFEQLTSLLEAASKPGGKNELTGEEIGFKSMKSAKVELYDFSSDTIQVEPSVISSKYKQVTIQEFMNTLKGIQ